MNRLFNIIAVLIAPLIIVNGQVTERARYIQVNGIITDEDNRPVPHVTIISKKLRRGTMSEPTGIYSIVSQPGDTIFLSALGYKKIEVFIPGNIESRQFTNDIVLLSDTIAIGDVVILPWKSYEEFRREVLAEKPVRPEIANMYENLANIQNSVANSSSYNISPEAAYRYAMQQNVNGMMTKNQYPVNNLLNPFAWAKFFNGIKHGLLKNQKTTQTSTKPAKTKKKKPARDQ